MIIIKTAVVTGSSSGIGLEIVKILLNLGYFVYGVSRTKKDLGNNFVQIKTDITKIDETLKLLKQIKSPVHLLINNAGIGFFAQHEDLKPLNIEKMIQTNLTAPLMITNMLLKSIKQNKGTIINITSISGKENSKFGAVYGATKAGLESFGKSLFDECRKSGVKVVNIAPDLSDTSFFDQLTFKPADNIEAKIDPKTIAKTVEFILEQPKGAVITELTIRPQRILIDKKTSARN